MITAAGAGWVLVGHSERRQLFGETDEMCGRKVRAALRHGLRPMLCVGETLEEREAGRARAVVLSQLTRAVDGLDREEYRRLAIAYEPVWAIGTGRTAAPRDAQEMHAAAREVLARIASPELARAIPVLYGGSVKPDNALELLTRPDVDGALVGGASLDPASFAQIVAAAMESLAVP
jgi:triosephosphate isomerase